MDKDSLCKREASIIKKVQSLDEDVPKDLKNIWDKILLLVTLVSDYIKGVYRDISDSTIVMIVTTLIYFVTPLDVIPDFLPIAGYSDDLSLFVWLFNQINEELNTYQAWKNLNRDIWAL